MIGVWLPICSTRPGSLPFIDVAFTAVSAVCVIGRHGILAGRITMTYYESGPHDLAALSVRLRLPADIREFFAGP